MELIIFANAARWLAQAMHSGHGEPRLKLRLNPHRPKEYDLLNKPRLEMQERLENAGNAA